MKGRTGITEVDAIFSFNFH